MRAFWLAAVVAGSVAAALAAGQQIAATSDVPASVQGRVVVRWTYANPGSETVIHETGMLTYAIEGRMMRERARRAWAPVSFPSGYRDTTLPGPAYLPARLVQAAWTRTFAMPCADGGSANLRTTITSIVDPRAVLTHDETLEVDVLRSKGTVNVMPYFRDRRVGAGLVRYSTIWRPLGTVHKETTGNRCPETVDTLPPTVDVSQLLPLSALISWSSPARLVAARLRPDGTVALHGSSSDEVSRRRERTTMQVDVDLTLRGTFLQMDATCTWPSERDLAGTTTVDQALAIVRRAGLETTYGGSKQNLSVPRGHFYIHTGAPTWRCGTPLHGALFRASQ